MGFRTLTLVICTVSVFALGSGSATPAWSDEEPRVEREQLEQVEDHAESLANQLHDLSLAVRDGNIDALASHFAEDMHGRGWRQLPGAAVDEIKWIRGKQTELQDEALGRTGFVRMWSDYLAQFSSIEDVRFKVKAADFRGLGDELDGEAIRPAADFRGLGDEPGTQADALIYFAIVGRDLQGRRTWVESKAHIYARLSGGRWQIHGYEPKYVTARHSEVELFSEVALAAGVYQAEPPFGTPGNRVFVAHGVAVADVDGDGLVDALATGASQNYLYRNKGDGTFENVAVTAGLAYTPMATGPLFLDVDEDGDQDLFLAAAGHQMLFENRQIPDGDLVFVDVSQEAGVAYPAQGFSAVAGDVNADGRPDIYVASYNQYGTVMPNSWSRATNGTANLLFINQGNGRYVEAAAAWGVDDRRWSYAAHFGDFDGDGRADLYVANDFGENGLFLNQGETFSERAGELGVLDPGNGMGVSVGDYNNDGRLDLHVTNMSSTAGNRILKRLFPEEATQLEGTRVLNKLAAGNTLFANVGGGQYKDVSAATGPFSAGWSFGGGFVDFDNDGWEDLHSPNGFISGKGLKDT